MCPSIRVFKLFLPPPLPAQPPSPTSRKQSNRLTEVKFAEQRACHLRSALGNLKRSGRRTLVQQCSSWRSALGLDPFTSHAFIALHPSPLPFHRTKLNVHTVRNTPPEVRHAGKQLNLSSKTVLPLANRRFVIPHGPLNLQKLPLMHFGTKGSYKGLRELLEVL
jgi:hypothetical protein